MSRLDMQACSSVFSYNISHTTTHSSVIDWPIWNFGWDGMPWCVFSRLNACIPQAIAVLWVQPSLLCFSGTLMWTQAIKTRQRDHYQYRPQWRNWLLPITLYDLIARVHPDLANSKPPPSLACMYLAPKIKAWPGYKFHVEIEGVDEFDNPTTTLARFHFMPFKEVVVRWNLLSVTHHRTRWPYSPFSEYGCEVQTRGYCYWNRSHYWSVG